ncbi:crossover junction endodeoxyribonuclease RuvC [Caenispirillum bisanense]|uniref:crossover junction endodeoxyribonuclease RuvC n=1 Tax=Caenispirillum bisanense TaxID=414052 RepID=UPI0031E17994
MRVLGLDPGLRNTGWGVIEVDGNRLRAVADGTVRSDESLGLAERLAQLYAGLERVIAEHAPHEAAVENTFVNVNPASTLKLGQARGVVLLAPARAGIPVSEYQPSLVKKAVVGTGVAAKQQMGMMVKALLPGAACDSADSADALAVAICHAHFRASAAALALAAAGTGAGAAAGGRRRR